MATRRHEMRAVLEGLEKDEKGHGRKERLRQEMASGQLPLFAPAEKHPALQELAELDVNSLSPLEAITKLYELQQKTKG